MGFEEIPKRLRSKRRLVVIPIDEFRSIVEKAVRDAFKTPNTRRRNSSARLISKREAARQLGIDRTTTLQSLIDRGELRTVKLAGKIRIPISEIELISTPSSKAEQGRSLKAQATPGRSNGDAIRALPF